MIINLDQTPSISVESYNKLLEKIESTPLLIANQKRDPSARWYENLLVGDAHSTTLIEDLSYNQLDDSEKSKEIEDVIQARVQLLSRAYAKKSTSLEESSRIEILNSKLDEFDNKFRLDQLNHLVVLNEGLGKTVERVKKLSDKYK